MIEWIRCEDELPPDNRMVLMYVARGGGIYLGGYADGTWYWCKGLFDVPVDKYYKVTHWAKLTPPEDEQ